VRLLVGATEIKDPSFEPSLQKGKKLLAAINVYLSKLSKKGAVYALISGTDIRNDVVQLNTTLQNALVELHTVYDTAVASRGPAATKAVVQQDVVEMIRSPSVLQFAAHQVEIKGLIMEPGDELFQKLEAVAKLVVPQNPQFVQTIHQADLKDMTVIHEGSTKIFSAKWNGSPVMVKSFINPSSKEDQELFIKAVRSSVATVNPNIVQVFGVCSEPDFVAIVMEHMQGTLREYLAKREYNWTEKLRMITDIANALAELDQKNILHRNLSSRVFLYDEHGTLKLTDFTMAKHKGDQSTQAKEGGGINPRGTYQWMAPELITVKPRYSSKSEIYAFAVIVWEICTGKFPREGLAEYQLFKLLKAKKRDEIPNDVPDDFKQLITMCWEHDPDSRPSIADVLLKLKSMTSIFGQPPESPNLDRSGSTRF